MAGENLDQSINTLQAELESQKKDVSSLSGFTEFFESVDNFQSFDQIIQIDTPEAQQLFTTGKEEVNALLLRAAARGKSLIDSKEAGPEKKVDVKNKSSEENFYGLAGELVGIIDKYVIGLQVMVEVEKSLDEVRLKEITKTERMGIIPEINDSALMEAIIQGLDRLSGIKKVLVNNPNLPADFRALRLKKVNEALKNLADKKIKIEQRKLILQKYQGYVSFNRDELVYLPEFYKLDKDKQDEISAEFQIVEIVILDNINAASCAKPLERFWQGKLALRKGDLQSAWENLTAFIASDLPGFATNSVLKNQESYFKTEAEELLDRWGQMTEEQEKLEEKMTQDNKDFFEADKLFNQGDLIGSKYLLRKYLAENEKVDESKDDQKKAKFVESAKGLLKKIARMQVLQIKARFAAFSIPHQDIPQESYVMLLGRKEVTRKADPRDNPAARTIHNPAYDQYIFYQKALEKIQEKIEKENLDFDVACKQVLPEDFTFDPQNKYNFLADELLIDKENPEESRLGLLNLARKYRAMGNTKLAEQYFRQYFGGHLKRLAEHKPTMAEIQTKYNKNVAFQAEIRNKIKVFKARRLLLNPSAGELNPSEEIRLYNIIQQLAFQEILPRELLKSQQINFNAGANYFGNDQDRIAWEDFTNMMGLHGTGKDPEMFMLSDDEMRQLIIELPIDVLIIAISGGVGGMAGGAVTRQILGMGARAVVRSLATAGVEIAEKAVLEWAAASGFRRLAGYTGGLLVENTVFTGTSSTLNGMRSGQFNIDETFAEEWVSGLRTLGGLGMVGRLSHGLKLNSKIALGLEMAGMGNLHGGHLTLHDIGTVLGLRVGHAVTGRGKNGQKETREMRQEGVRAKKEGRKLWKEAEREYRNEKSKDEKAKQGNTQQLTEKQQGIVKSTKISPELAALLPETIIDAIDFQIKNHKRNVDEAMLFYEFPDGKALYILGKSLKVIDGAQHQVLKNCNPFQVLLAIRMLQYSKRNISLEEITFFAELANTYGDGPIIFGPAEYYFGRPLAEQPQILQAFKEIYDTPIDPLVPIILKVFSHLSNSENFVESWQKVKLTFLDPQMPEFAKQILLFDIQFGRGDFAAIGLPAGSMSEILSKAKTASEKHRIILLDLVKTHLDSNNPSLRKLLEDFQANGESAERILEGRFEGEIPKTEKDNAINYVKNIVVLFLQSTTFKDLPYSQRKLLQDGNVTEGNYRNMFENVKNLMEVQDGQTAHDRLAELYFQPLGCDRTQDVLNRMDQRRDSADERNRAKKESSVDIRTGDLVKHVRLDNLASILENGILSGEFNPAAMADEGIGDGGGPSNRTPLGPDFYRLDKDNDIVSLTPQKEWGDIVLIIKDRGQFYGKEEVAASPREPLVNSDRYEIVKPDNESLDAKHVDVRIGIGSTEIDGIIIERSAPADNIQRVKKAIVENGQYIPVYDEAGILLFSPKDFDRLSALVE